MLTPKQLKALEYGRRGGYWKHTEKYKEMMSKSHEGKLNPMWGKFGKKHHNWTRRKLVCDYCKKDYWKPKCLLHKYKFHHFCCYDCKRKWRLENRITRPDYYYGKDWDKIRVKALKRDAFKCVNCGSEKRLEIHHIRRWLDSKDNGLGNLITLCRICHRKLE